MHLVNLIPDDYDSVRQELELVRGLGRTKGCHGHVDIVGPTLTATLESDTDGEVKFASRISYAVKCLDTAAPLPPHLSQNPGVMALFNYILGEERRRIDADDYAVTPEYLYDVISRPKDLVVPDSVDIPELESELLRYQRKTVRWCLRKEGKDLDPSGLIVDLDPEIRDFVVSPPTGWRETTFRDVHYWANPYTANICSEDALRDYVRGLRVEHEYGAQALLSEEMGLGKSIEMISLILLNRREIKVEDIKWEPENDVTNDNENGATNAVDVVKVDNGGTNPEVEELGTRDPTPTADIDERLLVFDPYLEQVVVQSKTTLIICPNSIRTQWVEEMLRHAPSLKVFVYMGMTSKQRTPSVAELCSYDIVITTYHSISRELHFAFFNPSARSMRNERSREDMDRLKSPLVRIQFWRVILDEVQMVNTGVSKAAQVARIIPRVHAWGVTGTPMKKSMADLQGIFVFLRMDPFTNTLVWNQVLATPADFETILSTVAIRHTAAMVKDDISIPPQTRYVLSLPFNPVEENNYQHLYASFLDECGVNEDGTLRNPAEPVENGKLASWFLRLRQACGHARIGQSNRRALGGGPLRTVDDILNAMTEQTRATLLVDMRRFYVLGIEKGQIREAVKDPVGALSFWKEAVKGVEPILESIRQELQDFKEAKAKRQAELEEELRRQEEEAAAKPVADGEDKVDADEWEEIVDDEHDDRLIALNLRLKSWLDITHRCYFFIATGHYQIGSLMDQDMERSQVALDGSQKTSAEKLHKSPQKVRKLSQSSPHGSRKSSQDDVKTTVKPEALVDTKEDPDATPPFTFVALGSDAKRTTSGDTSAPQAVPEPAVPTTPTRGPGNIARRLSSASESPQEAGKTVSIVKYDEERRKEHQEQESLYYQRAELLRREILQEPIKKVESLVKTLRKRAKLQKFASIEDATLEEGKLRVGLESRYLLNSINDLGVALNQQAEVIDEWREELVNLLASDIVDEDTDPDGEEYAKSLDAQEYAFSYLEVLQQVLADRSLALVGNADSVMEKANQYSTKSDMELELLKTRQEIVPLELDRGDNALDKCLKGLLNRAKRGLATGERAAVENQLMGQISQRLSKIYTAQMRGLRDLTKEVGFFRDLYNARVAYYKRLQELSDNVQSLEIDPADAPKMMKKRTREEKALTSSINQLKARQRFLQTLSGSKDEPEEERICVICQCSFTIGCLTVCGHQFCRDCLQEWWNVNRSCPLCKRRIRGDEVYNFTYRANDVLEANEEAADEKPEETDKSLSNGIFSAAPQDVVSHVNYMQLTANYSSKIDFIVRHLMWLRSKDPKTQVIIFSQWSEMLDLISVSLTIHRIQYATVQERMDEFRKDSEIACFLLHAKSES